MEKDVEYDLDEFIRKARRRSAEYEEQPYDETTFRNYRRFSNLEEHEDYYQQIKVCKAILNDIRSRSHFLSKMEKYSPGISSLSIEDVAKIRYSSENESYIVYADGTEFDIYEDDMKFIYPSIVDIPDSYEFEVVIEDSSVYVYNKFTADQPFRVFGAAEAAEE
ncbi:MAG: hypothetical protein HXS52_00320 [Theionarchaea archaeon]|nr:hypothetical protein [Theionarchaea archaeon]MBU7036346.1 hypothetical protein [Theionarchaea archaeon]